MSKINVLNESGHSEVEWLVEDATATQLAEAFFKQKMAEGYTLAIAELEDGTKEVVHEFVPSAKSIAMSFPLAGG